MKFVCNKIKLTLFISVIFCCLFLFQKEIKALELKKFSRQEMQEMVVSTALQYFYKHNYSDYEQTTMSKFFNFREHLKVEEISRSNMYYNDCSSFVTDVYYSTFGYTFSFFASLINDNYYATYDGVHKNPKNSNIEQWYMEMFNRGMYPSTSYFASKIKEEDNIAKYVWTSEGNVSDDNAYEDFSKKIVSENKLNPGDILVYRTKNGGHAMLYVGKIFEDSNGNLIDGFIHSTGKDYKFSNEEKDITLNDDKYSIRFADFNVVENRMNNSTVISYMILRPIDHFYTVISGETENFEVSNLDINSIARSEMKNLRLEQYISSGDKKLGIRSSVNLGDNVSINLNIKNMSDMEFYYSSNPNISDEENTGENFPKLKYNSNKTYKSIVITNKLPDNTKFKNCNDCEYNDAKKTITFSLSLEPGEEKTLSYEVLLNDNSFNSDGMNIKYNSLTITMPSINISVIPNIKPDLNSIIDNMNLFTINDSLDFVNSVYEKAYGISNVLSIDKLDSLFSTFVGDFNDFNGLSINKMARYKLKLENIKDDAKVLDKVVVKGMYGGRQLYGDDTGDRAHYMSTFDLNPGDIIIFWYNNFANQDAFIYTGRSKVSNTPYSDCGAKFKKLKINGTSKEIETIEDKNGSCDSYVYFKKLYDKDLFVVLRPLLSDSIKKVDGISVNTLPTKTKYFENFDELDLTGGVIEVKYSDGTKNNISMMSPDVKVEKLTNRNVGNKNVKLEYKGYETSFEISVVKNKVKDVTIKQQPFKNKYYILSEELDLTGGQLELKYDDGTTSQIAMTNSDVQVGGFNNKIIGNNEITLTYLGLSVKFDIEIVNKQIKEISILEQPLKKIYEQNSKKLDLTGGILEVKYNDGTTDAISMTSPEILIGKFDTSNLGDNSVSMSYDGKEVSLDYEVIVAYSNFSTNTDNIENPKTLFGSKYEFLILLVVLCTIGLIFLRKYNKFPNKI